MKQFQRIRTKGLYQP